MAGINKVILIGHIGKQPDLRHLADNVAVLSFPLATLEMIGKDRMRTEHNEWHNIVMWRALAESAFKLLKKGSLVCIEGKVRTRVITNNAEMKNDFTEIIANHFSLLGKNSDFTEE